MKKVFTTPDVWLAAALKILLNSEPELIIRSGKVLFAFPANEVTFKAISDFNSGVLMNAFLYSETVKRLKVRMFTELNNGGRR